HYREAAAAAEQAIAVSQAVGARGREVEAIGILGAALAILGDCDRGLAVLRDGLAMAHDVGDPDSIAMAYLGLASTLYDCNALEQSVAVGLEGSAWARGIRLPGLHSMAVEGLVPLGRWREATAILGDTPPAPEEETGSRWMGVFAGIIAVRTGRLDEARSLEH